ncbi:MAG: hypothetical protein U0L83_02105 [Muribaculaceae bacterium]|nr:hypothetical protein [Muribaculaceae bacterium]
MVGATYYFKDKIMSANGTEFIERPGTFWLMASYGSGNLNVDISVQNIFFNHEVSKTTLYCGPFRSLTRDWRNGRSVSVSLTYTFDYGKKVNPDISANVNVDTESSVLGR